MKFWGLYFSKGQGQATKKQAKWSVFSEAGRVQNGHSLCVCNEA